MKFIVLDLIIEHEFKKQSDESIILLHLLRINHRTNQIITKKINKIFEVIQLEYDNLHSCFFSTRTHNTSTCKLELITCKLIKDIDEKIMEYVYGRAKQSILTSSLMFRWYNYTDRGKITQKHLYCSCDICNLVIKEKKYYITIRDEIDRRIMI